MVLVEVLVAVFSAWFLYDAHLSFVRLQWREWAILQVLGIGTRRLAWWIAWQIGWVGMLSLAVGIGIGTLAARLFFAAVSLVLGLQQPLPWVMSGGAVLWTITFFMVLWFLLYVWTRWELVRRSPMDRLRQREPVPVAIRFSPVKAGLCLFCLFTAYGLAGMGNIRNLLPVAALCVLLTVTGTYGLYRQIVPGCLRCFNRLPHGYDNPSVMLAVSRFRLNMREVPRSLTVVTLLLTSAWTAVGVTGWLDRKTELLAVQEYPFHVQLLEKTNGMDHMQVFNAIGRHG
jgi:predicted lysophospholipase L1 biosynthesis ABC-type transport system permease subunit